MLYRLLSEETGFIISVELILIATIAVLGLIVCLTTVRNAIVSELSDVSGALQDLNQCFKFAGVNGHSGTSHGSDYNDATDLCDDADDTSGAADNCIVFDAEPEDESAGGEGGGEVTSYENSDSTTDVAASQSDTTLKWQLEPDQEKDADAVTQAIVDCIEGGGVAEISWTDSEGKSHTFTADTIIAAGPEDFGFGGTSSGSGSGKLGSATVKCVK